MPGKVQPGKIPGKEFTTNEPHGIKIGLITRIDDLNMKASVKVLTGGGTREEVDLTQAMTGPRSFWGGIPEVNSIVILGYRRKHKQLYEAMILGYLNTGNRSGLKFDPFAASDPSSVDASDLSDYTKNFGSTIRYKRLRLREGDVGGMSSSGAELVLNKDVRMCNRAGDLFELRDSDRTIVSQSVHRVESDAGVHRFSGPIRRSAGWLPGDIFQADGQTLRTAANRYFGADDLLAAGPGPTDGSTKFVNAAGKILSVFNDATEFPPVTFSNGRKAFYAATTPAANYEDADNSGGAEAFVEQRMEMSHTTDGSMDVLEEIDGFAPQLGKRITYIEQVLGTVVGNDIYSGMGQRQYARVLRPKIFDSFQQTSKGKFTLEEVDRSPLSPDTDSKTMAGAYLFKIQPPLAGDGDLPFAVSVSKQGKLFVNLPGSKVERYSTGDTKNVSAEINADGGVKVRLGASKPDNVSLHITMDGGIVADFGSAVSGQAIKVRYHSSYAAEYVGVPDSNDVAYSANVTGNKEEFVSSDSIENVAGQKATTVNGGYAINTDNISVNSQNGYSGNYGGLNVMISGKSQTNYALQVMETIALGGRITTCLAGAMIQNVLAGAVTYNTLAGATLFNNPAGAYTVNVGAGGIVMSAASGAIAMTAGAGAVSMTAGAGAVAITAGLAVSITSPVLISLISTQILLGGPPAVLGVCRGAPMMPPGSPSLDWITGLPLMGGAMVRSI